MEPQSLDELRRLACRALALDPAADDVAFGWRDGEIDAWINRSDLLPVALDGEARRQAARERELAALPAGERWVLERSHLSDRQLRDAVLEARRVARVERAKEQG